MSQPSTNPSRSREDLSAPLQLAHLLRPYSRRVVLTLVLVFALTAVNLVVPQLIAIVFDRVFTTGNWSLLFIVLLGLLGLYVLRNLLYFFSKFSAVEVGENIAFDLRNRLFDRLQQMNLQYYRDNKPGQLSSRVMNDSFVIQQFIQDDLPKVLQSLLMFLGILAVVYAMDWTLALVSTIILPLHLYTFHRFKRPIKTASRTAQEHLATATGNLIEKFLGMEVVKGFTGEARETQTFQQAIDLSRQSQLRSQKFHVGQKVMADLLVGLGMIGLLGTGAYQVIREHMAPGEFIAFFFYINMLYPTVLELMNGFAKFTKASGGLDRVTEVLHVPATEPHGAAHRRPQLRGGVTFSNVSFRYATGAPVLRNISFDIQPGQVCAIVGPSGAGKSTLMNILPRFLQPDQGRVLIDGIDAHEIDLTHLRQSIGMAFQECFLFNSTVLENLRYGHPQASHEHIVQVASRTGAHEFIMKLPNGYDTIVGESGVSLSRGQKQLITLTRAMLKNPHILILDEATSSIDAEKESRIIPAILSFMRGKTTLMITHRPELLKHADLVLQVEDGQVRYFGPPQGMADETAGRPVKTAEAASATAARSQRERPVIWREEQDAEDPKMASSGSWRAMSSIVLAAALALSSLFVPTGSVYAQDEAAKPAAEKAEAAKPAAEKADADKAAEAKAKADAAAAKAEAEKAAAAKKAEDAAKEKAAKEKAAKEKAAQEKAAQEQAAKEKAEAAAKPPKGEFTALTDMDALRIRELVDILSMQVQAEMGYMPVASSQAPATSRAPEGLERIVNLTRDSDTGTRVLQIGYGTFLSQPPHLWLYAATAGEKGPTPNDDLEQVKAFLAAARKTVTDPDAAIPVSALRTKMVKLSYTESDRALAVLKSLGYQTIEYTKKSDAVGKSTIIEPTAEMDPKDLPIIMAMPGPASIDLVGPEKTAATAGSIKLAMTPSSASALPNHTTADPIMEMLILYHPSQPQQLAGVLSKLQDIIDRPARQILLEAMVLEISETALNKLGVEWEMTTPFTHHSNLDNVTSARFGRLPTFPADESPTVGVTIDDAFNHWRIEVEALVREGQAEILSRPSVLTLDGRQASIRVGEEIPVATTLRGVAGGDHVQLAFEYIPVGILLNIRPRLAAKAEEVTLQIDGIVSAQVPGEDLVVRTNDGSELGRAPRISTRRVQTYNRVSNNTPFIIGGLISRDDVVEQDKVPVLGDIPILGNLFRSTRSERLEREVIIVITPYVLPEQRIVGRNLPKDEDAFDSFGNDLFRDAYRIRTEDVFDLDFLMGNRRLHRLQAMADRVADHDPDLAERYPFNRFVDGRVPGEQILVYRQIYEVIKRIRLDQAVNTSQTIFFVPDEESMSGFSVTFLERYLSNGLAPLRQQVLQEHADVKVNSNSLTGLEGYALAMTYTLQGRSDQADDMLRQPVPELRLLPCPDQQTWDRLLWEMNQPDDQGRPRHTILLRDQSDIVRLKRALVLERTLRLNAGAESLTLNNFTVGRLLLMPSIKDDMIHLVDAEVAKCFFYTEQYYEALQKVLQRDIEALKGALRLPEVERYFDRPGIADRPMQWQPER